MCGRYYIPDEEELIEIREIINEVNRRHAGKEAPEIKTGEVFPTNVVPILTGGGACAMKWGFSRWDGKGVVINARSEGIMDNNLWRKPVREARCLVPAGYYFEWAGTGKEKVKHRLRVPEQSTLYMAGIYRSEKDALLPVFSIITRAAAPGIAHIHDRMPVILGAAARREWLAPDAAVEDVLGEAVQGLAFAVEGSEEQQRMFGV